MDVFNLLGGELSDVSDWEDEESSEDNNDCVNQACTPTKTQMCRNLTIVSEKETDGSKRFTLAERAETIKYANIETEEEQCECVDMQLTGLQSTCETTTMMPMQGLLNSNDGDALNLFTINPATKQDAKGYPPLLGIEMNSQHSSDAHTIEETEVTNNLTQVTKDRMVFLNNYCEPKLAQVEFLLQNPDLDVIVVDDLFSKAECAEMIETVRPKLKKNISCHIVLFESHLNFTTFSP